MNPKEMNEALKAVSISPKEAFDTLDHAILLNKFEKIVEGDGNLLISEYIHTPEALLEYTEDMIAAGDVQNLSEALRVMQNEILKLRQDNDVLKNRNKQYLEKWDTWEERSRALYRELHGKDAPPQGG